MWAAIIPVIGFLFQIILNVVTHCFSSGDKKITGKDKALADMAVAAKKGDYDAFLDSCASFHSI